MAWVSWVAWVAWGGAGGAGGAGRGRGVYIRTSNTAEDVLLFRLVVVISGSYVCVCVCVCLYNVV